MAEDIGLLEKSLGYLELCGLKDVSKIAYLDTLISVYLLDPELFFEIASHGVPDRFADEWFNKLQKTARTVQGLIKNGWIVKDTGQDSRKYCLSLVYSRDRETWPDYLGSSMHSFLVEAFLTALDPKWWPKEENESETRKSWREGCQ